MSPVVLVVLIAWALLSVLFLTGTLLAARSIDRSVAVIGPNVEEIGTEGGFIEQAKSIAEKTVEIRKAALPLAASAKRTDEVAKKGIDPKLKSILGKVGDINQVAGEINTTVLSIGGTVDAIFGNASSINSSVTSIGGTPERFSGRPGGQRQRAQHPGQPELDSEPVNSIDRAVATIVGQATRSDVAPRSDRTCATFADVGTQHGSNSRARERDRLQSAARVAARVDDAGSAPPAQRHPPTGGRSARQGRPAEHRLWSVS